MKCVFKYILIKIVDFSRLKALKNIDNVLINCLVIVILAIVF